MSIPKKVTGTVAIPVLAFLILEAVCLAHGEHLITNIKSFDNFVVYTAIVMMSGFVGNWWYAAAIIVLVLVFSILIFEHTRFGYDYEVLKHGQKTAVNMGVREVPNALICYTICGGLMGIVGFLNAAFAVLSNEVTASMQAIINAVLLVIFLIYLNNEKRLLSRIVKR